MVEYFSVMVRKHGFYFGFDSFDKNKEELKEFMDRLVSDDPIDGLIFYRNIFLYFQYPMYVQDKKDTYDQAEIFAETIWKEIDKNGKAMVAKDHIEKIFGSNMEEYLEYHRLSVLTDADGMVILGDRGVDEGLK